MPTGFTFDAFFPPGFLRTLQPDDVVAIVDGVGIARTRLCRFIAKWTIYFAPARIDRSYLLYRGNTTIRILHTRKRIVVGIHYIVHGTVPHSIALVRTCPRRFCAVVVTRFSKIRLGCDAYTTVVFGCFCQCFLREHILWITATCRRRPRICMKFEFVFKKSLQLV